MNPAEEPAEELVEELVVLVDDEGRAVGTMPKRQAHHQSTPLHLAFSCYVFDSDDRLLLTRRALHKATWPGVWTNSFCGHPGPGEDLAEAVRRRGQQELGLTLAAVELALPAFRYRAVMPNGVRENELCPVFTARVDAVPHPEPEEVAEVAWVDWVAFRDDVLAGRRAVSPWCVEQVAALAAAEVSPGRFAAASADDLPAAARPDLPASGEE